MLASGILVCKKAKEKDIKLAGTGLCFFGTLILFSGIFFIADKYESTASYIVLILILILTIVLRVYAIFKT